MIVKGGGAVEVIVKGGGTVEQWNSDSEGWWNSGTVIVKGGGTVEQ